LLLLVAALAGFAYAWGIAHDGFEIYYAAAARTMSMSWHDFLFGAVDPSGTVTVDKLPGALWVQALSLRVFGFHSWAIVLPQVVEGVLTVLVLYRAVRRLAGPVAGITAAAVLAVTPATVALNRGNVSDSLLTLLLVLAADAASRALTTGSLRSLLLSGVWVGLAFQAKMLQAWLTWPALAVAYLVAAPVSGRRRVRDVTVAGLASLAVSLSWMTVVSLVPASRRPFVDGSLDNSVFSQVFGYNGIDRLTHGKKLISSIGTPAPFITANLEAGRLLNYVTLRIGPSWHRLITGVFGRDIAWLVPVAAMALIGVLIARRPEDRTDPVRAACLLWGTWLITLFGVFSAGRFLNAYYTAALSPPLAALCGIGVAALHQAEAWSRRQRYFVVGGLAVSLGYGALLLRGGSGVPTWILPVASGATAVAVVVILRSGRSAVAVRARWDTAVAASSALLLPAIVSASVVARGLGPFDSPYEPRSISAITQTTERRNAAYYENYARRVKHLHRRILFAADTGTLAAPYIFYTGREILPIGGYLGGLPAPSLAQLQHDIASKAFEYFYVPIIPRSTDPRIVWVYQHCIPPVLSPSAATIRFGSFICLPGAVNQGSQ
jgi:4-amino-4-deoxy-L-arabinose transferase-like glycosyltransferase